MLTDDTAAIACSEHTYRVHRLTRERLAEAERAGNATLYLTLLAQAYREMNDPAPILAMAGPVERWVMDGAPTW